MSDPETALPTLIVARRPRRDGAGWAVATSWFGGAPQLGRQPWPRGGIRKASLAFLAQIDLADVARAGGPTLGPDGALARGAQAHAVPGRAAHVVSTIGAGDAFFGALLARLQAAGWDAGALALDEALTAAAEAGARATETWGAVA